MADDENRRKGRPGKGRRGAVEQAPAKPGNGWPDDPESWVGRPTGPATPDDPGAPAEGPERADRGGGAGE